MKILGIDYGTKKIGLSLAAGKLALPWKILDNFSSPAEVVTRITEIIAQEKIDTVVIGWPVSLSGKIAKQATTVQNFITLLQQSVDIPILQMDERYSSQMAQKQNSGKFDDAQAAANILQTFLDKQ